MAHVRNLAFGIVRSGSQDLNIRLLVIKCLKKGESDKNSYEPLFYINLRGVVVSVLNYELGAQVQLPVCAVGVQSTHLLIFPLVMVVEKVPWETC